MDWELAIFAAGMAAELTLILLLFQGRAYRTFPAFLIYLCWSLFSDALYYYVRAHFPADVFFRFSLVQLTVDSVMIFALLVEVAWSVLRPIRSSLPKYSWIWIATLLALGNLILWPIAGLTVPERVSHAGRNLFLLQQTPAILRAVFFLALTAFSQLLSIGWRDRELQIATGLGFYSIVSLAVTMIHLHQLSGTQSYHWLDMVGGVSYLAALAYWVYSFATQPAERRQFTPQMRSVLMAMAGAAQTTRIALTDSTSDKPRKPRS